MKILLYDDDSIEKKLLEEALPQIKVTQVKDFEDFLYQIKNYKFDVILLDSVMPVRGELITKTLNEEDVKGAKVFMYSGIDPYFLKEKLDEMKCDVDGIISKTHDFGKLKKNFLELGVVGV